MTDIRTDQTSPTLSAGAILAAHRRESGYSVDDVAAKLKLAKRQVEAIEADRYRDLPGNTFVRGFVRNYARMLQLDPQPLLDYLDRHLPAETPQAALPKLADEAMPDLRPNGSSNGRGFGTALVVGVLITLVAFAALRYLDLGGKEPQLTLSPPATLPDAPAQPAVTTAPSLADPAMTAPAATTAATPAATPPTPATPTAPVEGEVRLVTKEDSWVQVIDSSGKRLIYGMVKAGEPRAVSGVAPYKVKIGRAQGAELYYKNQPADLAAHTQNDVASLELK
ncbi:helix-turn-helix domain-containing protein [Chitinimonas lacunae]|uniref:Helix-turn-helix domain-containing protein n=1 Tax=Chitinimonas lacunae TaxID=1963018 RepID=A0ABV8MM74_9NEIS